MVTDYSSVQAVDFAMGVWLNDCFSNQIGNISGTQAWQKLLHREPKQKISRGAIFDVRDSIRSIEANGLNRVMDGQFQANIPELPLIHYGRKPNIIIPESNAADVQHAVINLDSGENAEVYMRRIQVDYTVFLMANDLPTLDAMQLAFIRHCHTKNKFNTNYSVGGEVLEGVICTVEDSYSLSIEDVSVDRNERRLHAVAVPLIIECYAVMGAKVEVPKFHRWVLEISHCATC